MTRVELNENNEVTLKTTLTKGQVVKFNSLKKTLAVRSGTAYLSMNELHGVLLTIGRQKAREIVNAHRDTVRIYITPAKEVDLDASDAAYDYIRPIGLQVLLDQLAIENPRRATEYRASSALLGFIVADHPQLAIEGLIEARKIKSLKESIFARLKRKHMRCQLSDKLFRKGVESHIHHIVAESINPALATEESNLIVLAGEVHEDYHSWVEANELEINKVTLKNFAKHHGYNLGWANR